LQISDRQLAWFGIVLGAFLGLIPIFRDSNDQLRVACAAAVIALFIATLILARQGTGPQYTTLSMKKTLEIVAEDGSFARLHREQRIRVRYGHLSEIWCRNLVADGSITNLLIDGVNPDDFERTGCLLSICKKFGEPLFRGQEVTVLWTYDLLDSFPATHEALEHDITPGMQHLELEVRLPDGRRGRNAASHKLFAGEPAKQLAEPVVEGNGRTIRVSQKGLAEGSTIRLSWDW
jgi:hypothetical protein